LTLLLIQPLARSSANVLGLIAVPIAMDVSDCCNESNRKPPDYSAATEPGNRTESLAIAIEDPTYAAAASARRSSVTASPRSDSSLDT
jgi:hypothetical protein